MYKCKSILNFPTKYISAQKLISGTLFHTNLFNRATPVRTWSSSPYRQTFKYHIYCIAALKIDKQYLNTCMFSRNMPRCCFARFQIGLDGMKPMKDKW